MLLCFLQVLYYCTVVLGADQEWAVELKDITSKEADALARQHGLKNFGKIGNISNMYRFIYDGDKLKHFDDKMKMKLLNEPRVITTKQQIGRERVKRGYQVPYDSQWKKQWSLKNIGQTNGPEGLDLNVEGAWLQGITGKGVLVGVVDDGLEWNHPDIVDNYESFASHDFINDDNDPTPELSSDEPNSHGTSCAGEIAMTNNSLCGIGVAYGSKVASLKFDLSSDTSDSEEASALGHLSDQIMIYSNSWGPSDFGFIVDGPDYLTKLTFYNGVKNGRNGKGSIYVWAAGNGGYYHDSCAADGYVNSIYTIAVGSADQNGLQADYDEDCTAKIAVTYSYNSDTFPTANDDWSAYNQITTLDLNNGCTDGFTGTSASTPLVSATIALTLEANPDLTWRDIQYLIIYTSDTTKLLQSGEWLVNHAGLKVSPQFGFGAIDAEAMVTRAKHWTNVPEQLHSSMNSTIKSGNATYYTDFTAQIEVTSTSTSIKYIEHVVLTISLSLDLGTYDTVYNYNDVFDHYSSFRDKEMKFDDFEDLLQEDLKLVSKRDDAYPWLSSRDHARRGDIKVELTSPSGMKSVLLPYREFDFVNSEGYDEWPFMSLHHWGENPSGTWLLRVIYNNNYASVAVKIHSFEIYGTSEVPQAIIQIPLTCDPTCARGCAAAGSEYCDVCNDLRDYETLNCITNANCSLKEYNDYCIDIDFVDYHDSTSHSSLVLPLVISFVGIVLLIIIITIAIILGYVCVKHHKQRSPARYRPHS